METKQSIVKIILSTLLLVSMWPEAPECTWESTEETGVILAFCFTWLLLISKSYRVSSVDDGDIEYSFHFWFIKTREHTSGIYWFHSGGSKKSENTKNFNERSWDNM